MINRLFYNLAKFPRAIEVCMRISIGIALLASLALNGTTIPRPVPLTRRHGCMPPRAARYPRMMRKLTRSFSTPRMSRLFSPTAKQKGFERRAYKILRPDGRRYGTVRAYPRNAPPAYAADFVCIAGIRTTVP